MTTSDANHSTPTNRGGNNNPNRRDDGRGNSRGGQQQNMPPPARSPLPATFLHEPDMGRIITQAETIGSYLKAGGVETNQLRNFYEAVVQLDLELDEKARSQANFVVDAPDALVDRARLLPTRVLWSAAKAEGTKRTQLARFHTDLDAIKDGLFEPNGGLRVSQFKRFRQFVEAIVVYHSAYSKSILQPTGGRS